MVRARPAVSRTRSGGPGHAVRHPLERRVPVRVHPGGVVLRVAVEALGGGGRGASARALLSVCAAVVAQYVAMFHQNGAALTTWPGAPRVNCRPASPARRSRSTSCRRSTQGMRGIKVSSDDHGDVILET